MRNGMRRGLAGIFQNELGDGLAAGRQILIAAAWTIT